MGLTQAQQQSYVENGFFFLPGYFSSAEAEIIKNQLPLIFDEDNQRRVVEKDGRTVRSVYGSHHTNEVLRRLSKHPRLVEPSKELLGSDVYVYQFKVNAKGALGGDLWEWHQDYIFWNMEDGMPTSRVTNALIFVDEVTEFNGPLFLIPGSHKEGMLDSSRIADGNGEGQSATYSNSPKWISSLTANLKYSLDRKTVRRLVEQYGMVSPKGPKGSVLFFDSNIVHGSPNNMSPFDRAVVIITYNSVKNIPIKTSNRRPDFLVSVDHTAVTSLRDDALLI
jgi:ectoine hydroxylase-related dioxygenase (phytanoyl-CoA dioxygenase family)